MTEYIYNQDKTARVAIDPFDGIEMPNDFEEPVAVLTAHNGRLWAGAHSFGNGDTFPARIVDAFRELGECGTVQRWLRAFCESPAATVTAFTGYSQGDWGYVVSMGGEDIQEVIDWANGDAFALTLERPKLYTAADGATVTQWESDAWDGVALAYGDASKDRTAQEMLAEL